VTENIHGTVKPEHSSTLKKTKGTTSQHNPYLSSYLASVADVRVSAAAAVVVVVVA
jgi:hypothetical protein